MLSGSGLRARHHSVDRLYKYINYRLAPRQAKVHGHLMWLDRGDSMGLAQRGTYEPVVTGIIGRMVGPGDSAIDIGANIGYYTLLLARLVGAEGRVIAFEPDEMSFDILLRNVALNGYENVTLSDLAVSATNQDSFLYRDRFGNLDHRIISIPGQSERVAISTRTLDGYLGDPTPRIDFIKMDIQGAEGLALEGMRTTLGVNDRVILVTEYWPQGLEASGYGAERYLRSLHELGFLLFDLRAGETPIATDARRLFGRYGPDSRLHTNLLCCRYQISRLL